LEELGTSIFRIQQSMKKIGTDIGGGRARARGRVNGINNSSE
jgi:hypothetical protein